jgi:hypothetical protein
VWANTVSGQGYDMVFLGQVDKLHVDVDEVQARLEQPGVTNWSTNPCARSASTPPSICSRLMPARRSDLGQWTAGADINHDSDLRLSYLAGWGINSSLEDFIYKRMMSYRQPPLDIFAGAHMQSLFLAMGSGAQ